MDKSMQFMHNDFWNESQVAIIFQIDAGALDTLPITFPDDGPPVFRKPEMVPLVNLDGLRSFLRENQVTLTDFNVEDTLRRADDSPPDSRLVGKYLFRSLDQGQAVPTVIGFFHFKEDGVTQPAVPSATSDMPMSWTGNSEMSNAQMPMSKAGKVGDDNHQSYMDAKLRAVARIVNLINAHLDKEWNTAERVKGKIPVVAASPVWLSGATGCIPVGCPAIPPLSVPASASCSSAPGLWPITLQGLSPDMELATGEGVTVFILDTLPKPGEINRAAEAAEDHNLLLLDVANNVKHRYSVLPDSLDLPSPEQPMVGKDIYGRDIGFHMPDHGLFIAGIVRDLAPNAQVECIRILNDWCVGDMPTYTKALEDIHNRMLEINPITEKEGDLHGKPVVINMSLSATPSPEDALRYGLTENVIRDSLRPIFQSLVGLKAVFTASAGNESDVRQGAMAMNPSGMRRGAVLPAAMADEITEIISVGAVDSKGNPTSYSCYPGPRGIATYGGEVPKPAAKKSADGMTLATDIDALIGIYSATSYPALSYDDPHARYPVPNTHAWAYWVGTSFATPIITAVAARVQELKLRGKVAPTMSVANYVTNTVASSQPQVQWTRLETKISTSGTASGGVLKAVQCQPHRKKREDESREEVEINIAEVNIIEVDATR